MKYFKIVVDTPFAGTEETHYYADDNDNATTGDYEDLGAELCGSNADSFEYLVFGWNDTVVEDGEMTQEEHDEEIEAYHADCSWYVEEITKKEYNEEALGIYEDDEED